MSNKYLTHITLPNGEQANVGIPIFESRNPRGVVPVNFPQGQILACGRLGSQAPISNGAIKGVTSEIITNPNGYTKDVDYTTFDYMSVSFAHSVPSEDCSLTIYLETANLSNTINCPKDQITTLTCTAQNGVETATFFSPNLTLEDYGEWGVEEDGFPVFKVNVLEDYNGVYRLNEILESVKGSEYDRFGFIFDDGESLEVAKRIELCGLVFYNRQIPFKFYQKGVADVDFKHIPIGGIVADNIGTLYSYSNSTYHLPLGSKATVYSKGAKLKPTKVKGVSEKDIEDYSAFIGNGGNAENYKWDYDNIINLQLNTSNLPTLNSDSNCAFIVYFMTPDDLMVGEGNAKYAAVTIEGTNVYGAILDSTKPTEEEQNWDKAICTNGSWDYNVIQEFNAKVVSLNATTGMIVDDGTDLSILDEFVSLISDKEVCTDYRLLENGWEEDSLDIDTTAIEAKIQENADKIESLQTDVDNSISSFQQTINSVTSNIASINSSVRQNTSNISNNTDNIAELTAKVEENSEYIKTHKDEYYWLNKSVVGVFDELEEVKAKVDDFLPADYLIQMAQADGRLMCHDDVFGQVDIMTSADSYTTFLTRGGGCVLTQPIQAVWSTFRQPDNYQSMFGTPNYIDVIYSLPTPYYAEDGTVDASGLFAGLSNLRKIDYDVLNCYASKITGARRMFYNCTKLRPLKLQMDFPNLKYVGDMFYNACTVNAGYDENAYIKIVSNFAVLQDASRMFWACAPMSIDLSQSQMPMVETADEMFYRGSTYGNPATISLPTMPKIASINRMFYESYVTTISSGLQNCENVTSIINAFYGCSPLINLPTGFLGGLKISVSFAQSVNLTRESILNVINAVADLSTEGTTATLTLHATAKARLTEDDIAIATAKGWTIA